MSFRMWKDAERFLSKDKYIGALVKKYGKCTLEPSSKKEYFEDVVDAIVSQQLSIRAASTIFGRLKEKLDGEVVPENILKLRMTTIRSCGLSNSKASYIKDLAKKVKAGEVELHKMGKLPDDKVMDELITVKGVGPWTAKMFLMFSLGRPDTFPVEDLGLQNAFKKIVKRDIKQEKMVKFTERWKPYRTIASWYIWKSLDS